jgi:hypothetical protein
MDQLETYFQYQKEVAEAKLRIIERLQKGTTGQQEKRTSNIEIATHILSNAGRPLHVSEIIELAQKDFQIQMDRDSIVSGMIKKVKAGKMFIRTAPNTFALKEPYSK